MEPIVKELSFTHRGITLDVAKEIANIEGSDWEVGTDGRMQDRVHRVTISATVERPECQSGFLVEFSFKRDLATGKELGESALTVMYLEDLRSSSPEEVWICPPDKVNELLNSVQQKLPAPVDNVITLTGESF